MPQDNSEYQQKIREFEALCSELGIRAARVAGRADSDSAELSLTERTKLIGEEEAQKRVAQFESLLAEMESEGVRGNDIPAGLHFDAGLCYCVLEQWEKASGQFALCAEKRPEYSPALHYWGVALVKKYDQTNDAIWLEKGLGRYEQALAVRSDLPEVLADWGLALWKKYHVTRDIRQLELAHEKFGMATALKSDLYRAFSNWGGCLATLFRATGERNYIELAHEKCSRALEIVPEGVNPYFNPACVLGLMGRKEAMLEALGKAIDLGPEYRKFAREDTDLEAYWDDPDFLALVGEG